MTSYLEAPPGISPQQCKVSGSGNQNLCVSPNLAGVIKSGGSKRARAIELRLMKRFFISAAHCSRARCRRRRHRERECVHPARKMDPRRRRRRQRYRWNARRRELSIDGKGFAAGKDLLPKAKSTFSTQFGRTWPAFLAEKEGAAAVQSVLLLLPP